MGCRGLPKKLGLKLSLEAGDSQVPRNEEEKPDECGRSLLPGASGNKSSPEGRWDPGRSIRPEQSRLFWKPFHHGLEDVAKLCWTLLAAMELRHLLCFYIYSEDPDYSSVTALEWHAGSPKLDP